MPKIDVDCVLLKNGYTVKEVLKAKKENYPAALWKEVSNIWIKSPYGLYLYGNVGVGKTLLAITLMREYLEQYVKDINTDPTFLTEDYYKAVTVPKVNVIELLQTLRNVAQGKLPNDGVSSVTAIIDKHVNYARLILDDLGMQNVTDWTQEVLYHIINKRWEMGRKVIITTNLSLKDFGDRMGDRITSRIIGLCKPFRLEGPDRRRQGNDEQTLYTT